jgi:hypothetical protein
MLHSEPAGVWSALYSTLTAGEESAFSHAGELTSPGSQEVSIRGSLKRRAGSEGRRASPAFGMMGELG